MPYIGTDPNPGSTNLDQTRYTTSDKAVHIGSMCGFKRGPISQRGDRAITKTILNHK